MSDTLTSERIDHLCHVDEQGLLADSIPFWLKHGLDREFGGIMASLDRDGAVLDTDKGVWQQGRFAWMLGYLYNTVERRPDWLAAAESTLRFIEAHCFDADGYGLMNMTGVTAGSLVTSLLGKSADAGRLGRDIALLAIPVALAVVLQLMVLKPVSADKQDEWHEAGPPSVPSQTAERINPRRPAVCERSDRRYPSQSPVARSSG